LLLKKLQHRKISKAKQRLQLKSSKISFGLSSQFLCPLKRPLRRLANSFYREIDKQEKGGKRSQSKVGWLRAIC